MIPRLHHKPYGIDVRCEDHHGRKDDQNDHHAYGYETPTARPPDALAWRPCFACKRLTLWRLTAARFLRSHLAQGWHAQAGLACRQAPNGGSVTVKTAPRLVPE